MARFLPRVRMRSKGLSVVVIVIVVDATKTASSNVLGIDGSCTCKKRLNVEKLTFLSFLTFDTGHERYNLSLHVCIGHAY